MQVTATQTIAVIAAIGRLGGCPLSRKQSVPWRLTTLPLLRARLIARAFKKSGWPIAERSLYPRPSPGKAMLRAVGLALQPYFKGHPSLQRIASNRRLLHYHEPVSVEMIDEMRGNSHRSHQ